MIKRNQKQKTRADKLPLKAQRPADGLPAARGQKSCADNAADWHAQLAEERTSTVDADAPGQHPVGATSSANSVSADPFSRHKSLGAPVPQVTRHI